MTRYFESHRTVFGLVGAGLAFGIAVLYYFLVPEEAAVVTGLQQWVLRYGHSLCWVFISGSLLLWGLNLAPRRSGALAYAALATYVIFIAALMMAKAA